MTDNDNLLSYNTVIRRRFISLFMSLVLLTYVSGLGMQLHLAWEHTGAAVAIESSQSTHQRCSHSLDHHHLHDVQQGDAKGQDSPVAPASPDAPDSDCPTCVALACGIATFLSIAWHEALQLPLVQRLSIADTASVPSAFLCHPFSRGPPVAAI